VKTPELEALNKELSKLPNQNTFPDYKPHLTLAYLKKGEAAKYVGDARFEGKKLTFDSLTFSPPPEERAKGNQKSEHAFATQPTAPDAAQTGTQPKDATSLVLRDLAKEVSKLGGYQNVARSIIANSPMLNSVAVGAKSLKIGEGVVGPVTIDVVNSKGERIIVPTSFARKLADAANGDRESSRDILKFGALIANMQGSALAGTKLALAGLERLATGNDGAAHQAWLSLVAGKGTIDPAASLEHADTKIPPAGDAGSTLVGGVPSTPLRTENLSSPPSTVLSGEGAITDRTGIHKQGEEYAATQRQQQVRGVEKHIGTPPGPAVPADDGKPREGDSPQTGSRDSLEGSAKEPAQTSSVGTGAEVTDWDSAIDVAEKLPEGSFAGAEAFRQTGVNTRMVTIEKSEVAEAGESKPSELLRDQPPKVRNILEKRFGWKPDDPMTAERAKEILDGWQKLKNATPEEIRASGYFKPGSILEAKLIARAERVNPPEGSEVMPQPGATAIEKFDALSREPVPQSLKKEEATPPAVKESKPFSPKIAQEQKKYLLEEIDKAIAEVPEKPIDTEAGGDMDRLLKAGKKGGEEMDKLLDELFAKYNIPASEFSDISKEQIDLRKEDRRGRLDQALSRSQTIARSITIKVPGDGEFRILNDEKALKEFKERAKKFPTTVPKPDSHTPTPTQRHTAIPPVKRPEGAADMAKAVSPFFSDDQGRGALQFAFGDGENLVATNGRAMIRVKTKGFGTKENPVLVNEKGKPVEKDKGGWEVSAAQYPSAWEQVIPKADEHPILASDLDTGRLFQAIMQGKAVSETGDKFVTLHLNKDKTIGVSAKDESSGNEFSHNVQPVEALIGRFDVDYLVDGIRAFRAFNVEKINIHKADETGTVLIEGGPVTFVIKRTKEAPIRGRGGDVEVDPAINDTHRLDAIIAGTQIPERGEKPMVETPEEAFAKTIAASTEPLHGPVTLGEVNRASDLSDEELEKVADPVLWQLRGIVDVSGRDPSGIAIRGGVVYREELGFEKFSREAMAATVAWLKRKGANSVLIDMAESAVPKSGTQGKSLGAPSPTAKGPAPEVSAREAGFPSEKAAREAFEPSEFKKLGGTFEEYKAYRHCVSLTEL
jgi:hypothetical protein